MSSLGKLVIKIFEEIKRKKKAQEVPDVATLYYPSRNILILISTVVTVPVFGLLVNFSYDTSLYLSILLDIPQLRSPEYQALVATRPIVLTVCAFFSLLSMVILSNVWGTNGDNREFEESRSLFYSIVMGSICGILGVPILIWNAHIILDSVAIIFAAFGVGIDLSLIMQNPGDWISYVTTVAPSFFLISTIIVVLTAIPSGMVAGVIGGVYSWLDFRNNKIRRMNYLKDDGKLFRCNECGHLYTKSRWAADCEIWCEKHGTPKLDLIKHAIGKSQEKE